MILPARRRSLSPREDGETLPDLLEIASDSVLALSFEWQIKPVSLGGGGQPGQVQNAMKGARTMALKLPPDGVWSENLRVWKGALEALLQPKFFSIPRRPHKKRGGWESWFISAALG